MHIALEPESRISPKTADSRLRSPESIQFDVDRPKGNLPRGENKVPRKFLEFVLSSGGAQRPAPLGFSPWKDSHFSRASSLGSHISTPSKVHTPVLADAGAGVGFSPR